jgi:hypothetical protein
MKIIFPSIQNLYLDLNEVAVNILGNIKLTKSSL